jgi:multicomponent Na+:H+ antiporter subunit D
MDNFWLHPSLILILGSLLIPLVPARLAKGWLRMGYLLLIPSLTFARIFAMSHSDFTQMHGQVDFLSWKLIFGRVDALSSVFGYIMALMCILGTLYGLHVKDSAQHIASWIYVAGSIGCIYAGDFITLFLFWELMAFSSVFLIWFRGRRESLGAGYRYLLVHVAGGVVLLGGIVLQCGSIKGQPWAFNLLDVHNPTPAIYLIMVGFILNAAVPPLHAWLPDAYGEATFNGSVFMCAFTTKTAVYALCRGFAGMEILVPLGVIMALYGVVYAVLENDCRRLLAYHIISQVGYMVAGVGLGTAMAINGACAHAFAHILYKGLLFMGCGAVLHMTGESKFTALGDLWKKMPWTFVFTLIGGLSISAFPLFSGFVSKSMIVTASFEKGTTWAGFLLLLTSAGTFLHTGLKVPYFIWFGKNRPKPETWNRAADPPWNMNAAMAITSFLCIFIGCYYPYLYKMLPHQEEAAEFSKIVYSPYHVFETLQILLFTGLGFFLLLKKLVPDPTISLDMDWFYRKGGLVFQWIARKPIQIADTFVGELYRIAGLVPLMVTANLSGIFDNRVIDGAVDGLAESIRGIGRRLRLVQRGQMQQNLAFAFAAAAILGVAIVLFSKAPAPTTPRQQARPSLQISKPALQSTGLNQESVTTR